jgi:hypothetical protein
MKCCLHNHFGVALAKTVVVVPFVPPFLVTME